MPSEAWIRKRTRSQSNVKAEGNTKIESKYWFTFCHSPNIHECWSYLPKKDELICFLLSQFHMNLDIDLYAVTVIRYLQFFLYKWVDRSRKISRCNLPASFTQDKEGCFSAIPSEFKASCFKPVTFDEFMKSMVSIEDSELFECKYRGVSYNICNQHFLFE